MITRKLASIMTVKQIEGIEGKDKIGYVSFNECEWRVIASKDLHVGEKVLYLEYDSIIPEKVLDKMEQGFADTLKKRCWSPKYNGCVIRCMKMAGVVSYGILFKGTDVYPYLMSKMEWDSLSAGTDLTERLGIIKREDEDSIKVTVKEKEGFFAKWWSILLWRLFKIKKKKSGLGEWVPFIARTDEVRIQALPSSVLEELQGQPVMITEKLDGQSVTFAIYKKNFYVCSRNQCLYKKPIKKASAELIPINAEKQQDRFIATACKYAIAKRLWEVSKRGTYRDWAIQGERVGPGIQKNPYQLASVELFVFNVYDTTNQVYANYFAIKTFINLLNHTKQLGAYDIKAVPLIPIKSNNDIEIEYVWELPIVKFKWKTVQELEKLAKGQTFNGRGKYREGIVIRKCHTNGKDITTVVSLPEKGMSNMYSFKVINPDFILNQKD